MSGADDSEEEDWMSDKFLVEDVRTTVGRSREQARLLKLAREQETRERKAREAAEAEKLRRAGRRKQAEEEAARLLRSGIGAKLMQKMGHQSGEGLGAAGNKGRVAPVEAVQRPGRVGLGHRAEEDETKGNSDESRHEAIGRQVELTIEERQQAEQRQRKRDADTAALGDDYRERLAQRRQERLVSGDVMRSRRAAEQLDTSAGLLDNAHGFWPVEKQKQGGAAKSKDVDVEEDEGQGRVLVATSGLASLTQVGGYADSDAEEEKEEGEGGQDDLTPAAKQQRIATAQLALLQRITDYLRATHRFCVWCGCAYATESELAQFCPGDSRVAHDDV